MLDKQKIIDEINSTIDEEWKKIEEIIEEDSSHETMHEAYGNAYARLDAKLRKIRELLKDDLQWFPTTHLHRLDVIDTYEYPELEDRLDEIPDSLMNDIAAEIGEASTSSVFWECIKNRKKDILEIFACDMCGEYPCICEDFE